MSAEAMDAQAMEEELQQSVMVSEGDVEADEDMPDVDQSVEHGEPAAVADEGDGFGDEDGDEQSAGQDAIGDEEEDGDGDEDAEGESDEEAQDEDAEGEEFEEEGDENDDDELDTQTPAARRSRRRGQSRVTEEEEEDDQDDDEGVGAVKIKPGETDDESAPETKKCAYCRETVPYKASRCSHCTSFLGTDGGPLAPDAAITPG